MSGPPDPVLDALAAYTRWPIHRTPSAYRIRFSSADYNAKRITGLDFSKENECPYLDSAEFDQIPLLFEYIYPDPRDPEVITEVHYYTLNRKRHREDGPARYQITPIKGQSVLMEWYRHGLLDRKDGPARISYFGIEQRTLRDEYASELHGPYQLVIQNAELNWFRDGERAMFPYPDQASLLRLSLLFNEEHRFHDHGEEFAFQSAKTRWSWRTHGAPPSGLIPNWIEIDAYKDSYEDGVWKTRSGTVVDSVWFRDGETIQTDPQQDFPPSSMIDQFGLFQLPFYPSASVEVRLEAALSSLT